MSKLHIFTVHINPAQSHPYEEATFVEEGFSWKAFFFTGLWALYHRLWGKAFAIILANAVLMGLFNAHVLSREGVAFLSLGIAVFVGFQSGDWLRERLRRRGYIIADIVTGDSLLRGQQRFFDRYFATHPGEQAIV